MAERIQAAVVRRNGRVGSQLARDPFVTVIMPICNEAQYIERSLCAVLVQDYPTDQVEVLVVDGMSDDGTRDIVRRMMEAGRERTEDGEGRGRQGDGETRGRGDKGTGRQGDDGPVVRLLDNPERIVPTALNIGLREARGEVIVRVDGHCEIAPDYVRQCVRYLDETGAACVGGPIETVGETPVASAIALAMSCPFGVGNAAFRTVKNRARYVDTLAFGAYRREVFEQVGVFDEELIRNQDDEFNYRLIQAGERIYLTPDIRSVYHSRANLLGLWRQYFQYGLYKVRVMQKRGAIPSWRHLVPAFFVLGSLASLLVGAVAASPFWAGIVLGPYLITNIAVSMLLSLRHGWRYLCRLPLAFFVLHVGYGCGFIVGLFRFGPGRGEDSC